MRIRFRSIFLVMVVMITGREGGAVSPVADPLGAAGDLDKLVITGIPQARAKELRAALSRSLFVERAASPTGSTAGLLDRLMQSSKDAYQEEGYQSVGASAKRDGDTITLNITLGARYIAAPPHIDAPAGVDTKRLLAALNGPREKASVKIMRISDDTIIEDIGDHSPFRPEGPIWEVGETASFSSIYQAHLVSFVTEALQNQGISNAPVELSFDIDPVALTAAPRFKIGKPRPNVSLAQCEIKGAVRHTPEEIEKYLQITAGQPLDLATLQKLYARLYESGRFETQKMTLHQLSPEKVSLLIEVTEAPKVPKLNEPLSEREQALLRFCKWGSTFSEQREDLAFTVAMPDKGGVFRGVLSPQNGVLIDAEWKSDPAKPMVVTAVLARQMFGLRTAANQHLFIPLANLPMQVGSIVAIRPHLFTFNFFFRQASVQGSKEGAEGPVALDVRLSPAAFLEMIGNEAISVTVKEGVLEIKGSELDFLVDAATGKLREIRSENGDFEGKLEQGALVKEIQRIQAATDPNVYEVAHPLGSTLRFLAAAAVKLPVSNPNVDAKAHADAAAVMEKLLDDDLLGPIDAWASAAMPLEVFSIPTSDADAAVIEDGSLKAKLASLMAKLPPLYPYGSWPWTLLREQMLNLDPQASLAEVRRLLADKTLGPIGCLLAVAQWRSDETVAALFAQRGREQLTAAAFKADLAILLSGDAPAPRFARGFLEHLRGLTVDEVKKLAVTLPTGTGDLLVDLHGLLQLHKGQPVDKVLLDASDTFFAAASPRLDMLFKSLAPDAPAMPDFTIGP